MYAAAIPQDAGADEDALKAALAHAGLKVKCSRWIAKSSGGCDRPSKASPGHPESAGLVVESIVFRVELITRRSLVRIQPPPLQSIAEDEFAVRNRQVIVRIEANPRGAVTLAPGGCCLTSSICPAVYMLVATRLCAYWS